MNASLVVLEETKLEQAQPFAMNSGSKTVDTIVPSPDDLEALEIEEHEDSGARILNLNAEPGFTLLGFGFVPYKYIALVLLIVQTVAAIFIMRVSRTIYGAETPYLITTAVTMAELMKFLSSAVLVCRDSKWNVMEALKTMKAEIVDDPIGTLKVGVPAMLYTVQNNLLFIALSNVSGAVYQITYQLKILTTAILSVIILNRRLSVDRWISLFVLTAGVALIQLPSSNDAGKNTGGSGDAFVGIMAVLAACGTSGLAGVYLEKVLKNTACSIWLRNMQLALLGGVLALVGAYWSDYNKIVHGGGFFQGYNFATWMAILAQSVGGLIVAAVLKYADNILKCFGNAIAIILSCLVSCYFVGDYKPTVLFVVGTAAVCATTYSYGVDFPITYYLTTTPKIWIRVVLRRLFKHRSKNAQPPASV